MKKLTSLLSLIILFVFVFINFSHPEEVRDNTDNNTDEEIMDVNCQWVMCALQKDDLNLAKLQYSTVCNNPKYRTSNGYSWISFTVWHGIPEQVEWALSLPGVNVNDKFRGQTLLYKTVVNIMNSKITDENHPRYKILRLLLKHQADPMFHNDSEGNPPYSNGESTYELIKNYNVENTPYGKLILQSLNNKSPQSGSDD
jgi:hypothetical protein